MEPDDRITPVYEVKDGFDAIFVETAEDAVLVAREWKRRAGVIGERGANITIEAIKIRGGITEGERQYVERLRQMQAEE